MRKHDAGNYRWGKGTSGGGDGDSAGAATSFGAGKKFGYGIRRKWEQLYVV